MQRNNETREKNAVYQRTDVHKETLRYAVVILLQKDANILRALLNPA